MKYKTLNPVMHDGTLYPEGKALELDDTDADTLLACGAIEAVDEAAEATEPEGVETEQEVNSAEPEPEPEPEPAKPAPKHKKAKGNK